MYNADHTKKDFAIMIILAILPCSSGTYTVDGQTYLEGPKHENLLLRGMNCEIFIEVSRHLPTTTDFKAI